MGEVVRCFHCGKERAKSAEGKFIDGSWVDDWRMKNTEAWGKWVCSVHCYWRVVHTYGWDFDDCCGSWCDA